MSCPSAKLCLAAGAEATLLKSTDGGATWRPKQINAPDSVISQVYCQSESKCLALVADPLLGTGGVYESGDGGENWTETESWDDAGGVIDTVSCVGTGACYGIGEGGIFERGAADPHWHLANGSVFPAPPPARYLVNLACPSEQLCVALGHPRVDEEGIILRVTNGGADASRVSNLSQDLQGINFDAITCQNDTTCLAAGSNGVIIKSEDGGATWSRMSWTPPPSQASLELRSINCPSASVCFSVGGNPVTGECCGVIIGTVDGGKTWTNEKLDLPNFLWGVSCTSEADCVAVGDNGLIVRMTAGPVASLPTATSAPSAGDIIANAVMAAGVEARSLAPLGIADTFSPDQGIYHAIVSIQGAPGGTKFKVVWTAVDSGGQWANNTQIGQYEDSYDGTRYLDFTYRPDSGHMPVGSYKVDIYLNGSLARTVEFAVSQSAQVFTPATATAIAATIAAAATPCAPLTLSTGTPPNFPISVTMAPATQGDNYDPVNPGRVFGPGDTIHAVVKIQNAPDSTNFKAVWYADDTRGALPCNNKLNETALTAGGSNNLDFKVWYTPQWPVGEYRVEIYVDDTLAITTTFTVQ